MGKPISYRDRDLGDGYVCREQVLDRKVVARTIWRDGVYQGRVWRLTGRGVRFPGWYVEGNSNLRWAVGLTLQEAARNVAEVIARNGERP